MQLRWRDAAGYILVLSFFFFFSLFGWWKNTNLHSTFDALPAQTERGCHTIIWFTPSRTTKPHKTLFDQLVEPFIDMCKELQTNMYIANNKYTIQNNIPLQISRGSENVCSDRYPYASMCISHRLRTLRLMWGTLHFEPWSVHRWFIIIIFCFSCLGF